MGDNNWNSNYDSFLVLRIGNCGSFLWLAFQWRFPELAAKWPPRRRFELSQQPSGEKSVRRAKAKAKVTLPHQFKANCHRRKDFLRLHPALCYFAPQTYSQLTGIHPLQKPAFPHLLIRWKVLPESHCSDVRNLASNWIYSGQFTPICSSASAAFYLGVSTLGRHHRCLLLLLYTSV